MTIADILIDDRPVGEFLGAFADFLSSGAIIDAAGDFAINRIPRRTRSGLDVNDSPFAEYAPSYRKTGTVNLTVTGEMLDSLEVEVADNVVTVTCDSDYAQYHEQGTDTMPQRKFMGLSDADITEMLDVAFFAPLKSGIG